MTYAHTHATIVMICVEDPLGFEPRTTDLKEQGSATELRVHVSCVTSYRVTEKFTTKAGLTCPL